MNEFFGTQHGAGMFDVGGVTIYGPSLYEAGPDADSTVRTLYASAERAGAGYFGLIGPQSVLARHVWSGKGTARVHLSDNFTHYVFNVLLSDRERYSCECVSFLFHESEHWPVEVSLPIEGFAVFTEAGTLGLPPEYAVLIVSVPYFAGVKLMGGPIETRGRLRYIDGCSDSVLVPPLVKGDPCLNHLHFPPNTKQTQHTHPSLRAGIVAAGRGTCILGNGSGLSLEPGALFIIPPETLHSFETGPDSSMDVIAFHPESDWGPEHETHPMVNRTLVDGRKIDNTTEQHRYAEVIDGHRPLADIEAERQALRDRFVHEALQLEFETSPSVGDE